jgi:hypothetical protein
MTLEQAQQLIIGETYLFRYNKVQSIKAVMSEVKTISEVNITNILIVVDKHYIILKSPEDSRDSAAFDIDDIELIGVYSQLNFTHTYPTPKDSKRDGDCL